MRDSKRVRLGSDVHSDSKETSSVQFRSIFVLTSFGSQRVKFSWRIIDWKMGLPNFGANGNRLFSPLFESSDGYKWKLKLLLVYSKDTGESYMVLYLCLEEGPVENVMVIGSLSIEGVTQEKINQMICPQKKPKVLKSINFPVNASTAPSTINTGYTPTKEMENDIVAVADFRHSVNRVTEAVDADKSKSDS